MRWLKTHGMHLVAWIAILAVAGLWAAGILNGVVAVPTSAAPLEKVTALYLILALAAASIIVIILAMTNLSRQPGEHRRHRRILH